MRFKLRAANSRQHRHTRNGWKRVGIEVFHASEAYPVRFLSSRLIRSDLADNWNIDVAAELEEYLEDLESVMISFDGGKSNLNFAEAALMIQVSNRLRLDA